MPQPAAHRRDGHVARGLHVVETFDGQVHLGNLHDSDGAVTVYTGYVGRPAVIARADIAQITPAEQHPDIETAPDRS